MIRINLQQLGPKGRKRKAAAAEPAVSSGGSRGGGPPNILPALMLILPVALGVGGAFYVHQGLAARLEETLLATKAAEAELARLKPVLDELERFKKDKASLEQKLAAIKALEGKRHGPVRIFTELGTIMPAELWVTSVRETDMKAEIEGLGLDAQTVAVFVSAMERSPYFGGVELRSVEQVTYLGLKVRKFKVSCQFVLPQQAAPAQAALAPAAGGAAAAAR